MSRPIALGFLLALAQPAVVFAQTTIAVSVDSFGNQPQGSSGSVGRNAISADGRHTVFHSNASLAPGGSGLFDHDRLTGETVRIAHSLSYTPTITVDGSFVAFETTEGLDPADTNGGADLYLWDRQAGTYEAVNVSSTGERAAIPFQYGRPSISADGRFIAFSSAAWNLDPADTHPAEDVFLRDRQLSTTTLVSAGAPGGYEANVSADGAWVVYVDHLSTGQLQLWSRALGTTLTIHPGAPTAGIVQFPSVSQDGRFIVCDLVVGGQRDVWMLDRQSSTSELISSPANGPAAGGGYDGHLTPNATYVTFTGSDGKVYLIDRMLGTSECVSRTWTGAISTGEHPATTPDGRFTAFRSSASNMVPNQTNPEPGMFLRDRNAVPEVVTFCHGDGSSTSCPCANNAATGTASGCLNSTGVGASLFATGTASIAADTVVLTTVGMPNSISMYVRGTCRIAGGAGTTFGDGLRCVAGTLTRLGTRTVVSGASSLGGQLSNYGALAGVAQQFQTWYRNPAPAFCTPGTFNLSNALTILWGP